MSNIEIPADISSWHKKLYKEPTAGITIHTPNILICPPNPEKMVVADLPEIGAVHKGVAIIGPDSVTISGDLIKAACREQDLIQARGRMDRMMIPPRLPVFVPMFDPDLPVITADSYSPESIGRGFAVPSPDDRDTSYSFTNRRNSVDSYFDMDTKYKPPQITCRTVTDKQISKARKKNKLAKQSRKRNRG